MIAETSSQAQHSPHWNFISIPYRNKHFILIRYFNWTLLLRGNFSDSHLLLGVTFIQVRGTELSDKVSWRFQCSALHTMTVLTAESFYQE